MKKQLLTLLSIVTAFSTFTAQLDSTAFFVAPASGMLQAQYINVPITNSLQFTNQFTLECWIFVPTSSSQEIHLIESYFGNSGGYVLRLAQSGRIKAYAMGASQPSLEGTTTVPLNSWNHVAATYNSTTGELKVFLNGVEDAMSTPNIAIYNNASLLKVGARGDDNDVNDLLYMDEVRMWNVARSAAEITGDMNHCLTGNETGLVLYYDFENETVSGVVTDRTANGNNGSIVSNMSPYDDGVFECSITSQINENETLQFDVYPNPSSDQITVQTEELIIEIKIFNVLGELVQMGTSSSFSIANLPKGMYLVQVISEKGMNTTRIIRE